MSEDIYLIAEGGTLVRLSPRPYENEDLLQRLLASHPEVLGFGDSGTERRLMLIAREQGVPDTDGGDARWSLDHLFLDQDAVPVLVEAKRGSDPRARREVVAQMLDYAANGVVYWPMAELRSAWERTCEQQARAPGDVLAELIGPEADQDEFWRRTEANLRSGRVRLVFVADRIPPELRRIIEFLNEQMRPAVVIGIEIKQYVSDTGLRSLVPRVVGQTAASEAAKSERPAREPITDEQWWAAFEAQHGAAMRQLGQAVVQSWAELYDTVAITSAQDSYFAAKRIGNKLRYALFLERAGRISLATRWLSYTPGFTSEAARRQAMDTLEGLLGEPLSTQNTSGFPAFRLDRLTDPAVRTAFLEYSRWLSEAMATPEDARADAGPADP
ncbi:hypothetical protein [Azospirillum halopraeferens]|uniref:hypothetical protein n=1 Tax=Azospirillum halopraeferens TaxID=34010 RepID=UPI0003F5E4F6|nr:hypothetical protein [Azospirillum halopraeferens]